MCALAYTISVLPEELPDWLTTDGGVITVISESALDTPDTLTITIEVDFYGTVTSGEIEVELYCETDTSCDSSWRSPALESVGCDNGSPTYLENHSSTSYSFPENHEWFIDYRNYILTRVQMWKNNAMVSGFMLTYEPDRDGLERWPTVTHMFGND